MMPDRSMSRYRYVAVIDIGKTSAKLALVDLREMAEIEVRRQPNTIVPGPPYPHYDTDALWRFILAGLGELNSVQPIDAITVTAHGASAALLDSAGELAAPILDYEHDGPDTLSAEYDAARPDFAETGSPRLPMGLNLGAQLFWQFRAFPEIRAGTRSVLTYPQYWAFRLCGVAADEVTSLGCHTDLWNPHARQFSSLVADEGWAELMAPVAKAADLLGALWPEVANATGVAENTPVYCGIHDSNASLYAHLTSRQPPFAVVSTGTWVISMAIGGRKTELDPGRDTLVNVNAFGEPVPSARFMGGREFERMTAGLAGAHDASDISSVIDRGAMLLPAVETRSGPFQGRRHRWTVDENTLSDGERFVAISFYLALMTMTGLEITGADGAILVEGPFAENKVYIDMLAAATGRPVSAVAGTGTSIGAALLVSSRRPIAGSPFDDLRIFDKTLAAYASRWTDLAAE